MVRHRRFALLTSLLLSSILTACGGGGGGGGGGSTSSSNVSTPVGAGTPAQTVPEANPNPTSPPATSPANIQTSVQAPTYAVGSEELALFNLMNDFRAKLGLGLLAQNKQMDLADQHHLKYILSNSDINYGDLDPKTHLPYFHSEDAARTGYTGATPLDRAKFTGYVGTAVSEEGTYGMGKGAATALNDLIATVYHRNNLMYQFPREIGISIGSDGLQTTVMTIGVSGTLQKNSSDYLGVYPADKQIDVGMITRAESPNPYPELSLSDFATKTSYPVSITSEGSTTLAVTSFTLTEAGQNLPLDARIITFDTDANKLIGKNIAFVVGKAPFKPRTVYNVSFVGSVNGSPISKKWSFTTGN